MAAIQQLLRGRIYSESGRPLQFNLSLNQDAVSPGTLDDKLMAFTSRGEVVWIDIDDLINETLSQVPEAESSGSTVVADGDYGDVVVSSSGTVWMFDSGVVTTAGRALLDDANAAAQRTTLGLGTIATVNSPVPIADGGTGQTAQTAAFNALDPLTTKGDIIAHDGTNSVRVPVGTNNYVLTAASGETPGLKWAPAGGGTSAWVTIVKTTNTDTSSDNTINNDDDLQFTAAANTNYMVRIMLAIFSASATPDFKWNITFSGTETDSIATSWRLDDGSTAINNQLGDNTPGTGENTITLAANELNIVWIHYFLRVGASGGTVNFNWSQDTSDGTATTLYAGSFLEYLAKAP